MRFRNTLILALLVAAVGAYLWFVERPAVEKEAEKKTILDFDSEKASKVVLESGGSRIEIAREGGTWKITAPRALDADQIAVNNLVQAVDDAELKKTIEQPESLASFGLEPPVASITITLEDGRELPRIAVGKATPVGYSAYARRGEDRDVLLTTSAFQSGVKKELKDLRDKTVLPFQEDAVQEIRISLNGQQDVILRKEGNDWSLVKPVAGKADGAQVRSYLSTLRNLRAVDFVDAEQSPPDAMYGLVPPQAEVTLVVGETREEKKLLLGAPVAAEGKKEVYVERGAGGPIFTVGDYVKTSLAKKPNDLRDKTVLAFDKDKVGSVVVTDASGTSFTLERKDGKWILADAGDAKVKDMIIDRFVDDLRTLKGSDVVSETGPRPEFGLDAPKVKIEVRGADGAAIGTIVAAQVSSGGEEKIYATALGGRSVYFLNDYAFQRIDKHRADFVEKPQASPAAATAIEGGDGDAGQDDVDADLGEDPEPEDAGR